MINDQIKVRPPCPIHLSTKELEGIERRVRDFVDACNEFNEKKRRIKPTLVASFGLVGRLEGEGGETTQIEPVFKRPTKLVTAKNDNGPKLYEAWNTDILPVLTSTALIEPIEGKKWMEMTGLIGVIRCLKAAQQFLENDLEQGLVAFQDSQEMILQLSMIRSVVSITAKTIFTLAPSQVATLQSNHLFRSCAPDDLFNPKSVSWMARQSSLGEDSASGGSSDLDAVPLAYNERRDSRNHADHQLLHVNQQKLRDQLLNWIRLNCHTPDGQRTAVDIVRNLHFANSNWFARLLLHEYEQLASRSRIAKLEERLSKGGENPVLLFIGWADSFRLIMSLQQVIFDSIEAIMTPIIDGTTRSEPRFSATLNRLAALGRLLAVCMSKQQPVGRYEDPVLCFARDSLMEAWVEGHLLAVLPWFITWFRDSQCAGIVPVIAALRTCKFQQPAITLLLHSLSIDLDGMEGEFFKLPRRQPTATIGTILDEEESLPGLERVLTVCIPEFKLFLSELSSPVITPPTPLVPIRVPRKVRPTPSNTSPSALQRKLRQWLWWQYPTLREVGEVLSRHLEGQPLEEVAKVIWQAIPPILPPPLSEHERMKELVIALILEFIQKE